MRFLAVLVFLLSFAAVVGHITARTEIYATNEVCGLLRANYYKPDQPDVRKFFEQCARDSVPFTFTRVRAIQHINAKLSQIHSSHLMVYTPVENRQLWENEGSDTGVRARMIDGEMVVTGTLEGSPARRAELKAGDVVLAINDESPHSLNEVETTAGFFKIARGKKIFETELKLEDLHEDLSPRLEDRGAVAVLHLPSFLPAYFENWGQTAAKLNDYHALVIDLRDNAGGSFPAMLRALSPFRCDGGEVGRLYERSEGPPSVMADDLSPDVQLAQILSSSEVILKPFEGYGCFRGPVVVLTDGGTSSTAEIFANAFKARAKSEVWGWVTAGQVVMARWFSIGSLGGGDYAMSIPIAGFRSVHGDELENVGVRPERELNYDLETALRGEDSWVEQAVSHLETK